MHDEGARQGRATIPRRDRRAGSQRRGAPPLGDCVRPHDVLIHRQGPVPDAHAATIEAERYAEELNRAVGHAGYPAIRTWIAIHFFHDQAD